MSETAHEWTNLKDIAVWGNLTTTESRKLTEDSTAGAAARLKVIKAFLKRFYPDLLTKTIIPSKFLSIKNPARELTTETTIEVWIGMQAKRSDGLLENTGTYKKIREEYEQWRKSRPGVVVTPNETPAPKTKKESAKERREREEREEKEAAEREAIRESERQADEEARKRKEREQEEQRQQREDERQRREQEEKRRRDEEEASRLLTEEAEREKREREEAERAKEPKRADRAPWSDWPRSKTSSESINAATATGQRGRRRAIKRFLQANGVDINETIVDPEDGEERALKDILAETSSADLSDDSELYDAIRAYYESGNTGVKSKTTGGPRKKDNWADLEIVLTRGKLENMTKKAIIGAIEEFINNNDTELLELPLEKGEHVGKNPRNAMRDTDKANVFVGGTTYRVIANLYDRRRRDHATRPVGAGGTLVYMPVEEDSEATGGGLLVSMGSYLLSKVTGGYLGSGNNTNDTPEQKEAVLMSAAQEGGLRVENEALVQQNEILHSKVVEAEDAGDREKEKVKEVEREARIAVSEARDQVATLDVNMQQMLSSIASLEEQRGRDREEISQLKDKLATQKSRYNAIQVENNLSKRKVEQLDAQIEERDIEVAAARKFREEAEQLRRDAMTRSEEMASLRADNEKLERDVAQLQSTASGTTTSEAETNRTTLLEQRVRESALAVERLTVENQSLRTENERDRETLEQSTSLLKERQDEIQHLQELVQETGGKNRLLEQGREALEARASESDERLQRVQQLEESERDLRNEAAQARQSEKRAVDEMALAKASNNEYILRNTELIQEIFDKKGDLKEARRRNDRLAIEVTNLKAQVTFTELIKSLVSGDEAANVPTAEEWQALREQAATLSSVTGGIDIVAMKQENVALRDEVQGLDSSLRAHAYELTANFELEHITDPEEARQYSYVVAMKEDQFDNLKHHWAFYRHLRVGHMFEEGVENTSVPFYTVADELPVPSPKDLTGGVGKNAFLYRVLTRRDDDYVEDLQGEVEYSRREINYLKKQRSQGGINPTRIDVMGTRALDIADHILLSQYEAERLVFAAPSLTKPLPVAGRAEVTVRFEDATGNPYLSFHATGLPLRYREGGAPFIMVDMQRDASQMQYKHATGMGHAVFRNRGFLYIRVRPHLEEGEHGDAVTLGPVELNIVARGTASDEYLYGQESVTPFSGGRLYSRYMTSSLSAIQRLEISALKPDIRQDDVGNEDDAVIVDNNDEEQKQPLISDDEEQEQEGKEVSVDVFVTTATDTDRPDQEVRNSASYQKYTALVKRRGQQPIVLALFEGTISASKGTNITGGGELFVMTYEAGAVNDGVTNAIVSDSSINVYLHSLPGIDAKTRITLVLYKSRELDTRVDGGRLADSLLDYLDPRLRRHKIAIQGYASMDYMAETTSTSESSSTGGGSLTQQKRVPLSADASSIYEIIEMSASPAIYALPTFKEVGTTSATSTHTVLVDDDVDDYDFTDW